MDLLDRSVRQVDVPTSADALEELKAGCHLLVAAYQLDGTMKGIEFAIRVRQTSPETSVIIIGEEGDPDEFDDETAKESPFVYMVRPVDAQKFLRVLVAGMEGHDKMIAALNPPIAETAGAIMHDMGPVPELDLRKARDIVDPLLRDLSSMAIIIASRDGQLLLESGAVGYIDREKLVGALLPNIMTNISVRSLVGGDLSTIQFYDGDEFDVFVLSVGMHHFMCVLYDGQTGSRQFGNITRYARKAVLSLIDILGANAFFIQPPVVKEIKEAAPARRSKPSKIETQEEERIDLAPMEIPASPEPVAVVSAPMFEPISDFNPDDIFGTPVDSAGSLDDLFDPDKLEQLAKQSDQGKFLSWDEAAKIGAIKS